MFLFVKLTSFFKFFRSANLWTPKMANVPTWNTLWLDNLAKFAFPWNLWPNVLLDVFQKPHNLLTRGFHLPASTKIDLANTTLLRYMRYYFVFSWNWFHEKTIINTRKPTSIFIASNHIFFLFFLGWTRRKTRWIEGTTIPFRSWGSSTQVLRTCQQLSLILLQMCFFSWNHHSFHEILILINLKFSILNWSPYWLELWTSYDYYYYFIIKFKIRTLSP